MTRLIIFAHEGMKRATCKSPAVIGRMITLLPQQDIGHCFTSVYSIALLILYRSQCVKVNVLYKIHHIRIHLYKQYTDECDYNYLLTILQNKFILIILPHSINFVDCCLIIIALYIFDQVGHLNFINSSYYSFS